MFSERTPRLIYLLTGIRSYESIKMTVKDLRLAALREPHCDNPLESESLVTLTYIPRLGAEVQLERLVSIIVETVNTRDFNFDDPGAAEFRSRVTSGWEAHFDSCANAITFPEQTNIWRSTTAQFPSSKFRITNMSTTIRNHGKSASVFVHLEMRGEGNIELQGMCEWRWRLVDGRWVTHLFTAMRGPLDAENVGIPWTI